MKKQVASILCVDLDATILPDSPYTWDFFISHYLESEKGLGKLTFIQHRQLRALTNKPVGIGWHNYIHSLISEPIPIIKLEVSERALELLEHFKLNENELMYPDSNITWGTFLTHYSQTRAKLEGITAADYRAAKEVLHKPNNVSGWHYYLKNVQIEKARPDTNHKSHAIGHYRMIPMSDETYEDLP